MKLNYKVSPKLDIQVETKGIKDAFAFLGAVDSILGVSSCGHCGSDNLKFQHRKPKGYDYYSIVCQDCKHELKFGVQKETQELFPKNWEEPYMGGGNQSSEPSMESESDIPWAA